MGLSKGHVFAIDLPPGRVEELSIKISIRSDDVRNATGINFRSNNTGVAEAGLRALYFSAKTDGCPILNAKSICALRYEEQNAIIDIAISGTILGLSMLTSNIARSTIETLCCLS